MITRDFAGRTAVVTGGANGIGAGVARRLAVAGANVVIWDVDGAAAQAAAARINDEGAGAGNVTGTGCDVADQASVAAALNRTRTEFAVPTLVVTAAGIIRVAGFLDLDPAQWRRVLDVNLTGTFLPVQACARAMKEAGLPGAIACVSSVAGRGPRADSADYAASKAGVISLVRSAAVALAPFQITVNAACPGIVRTEMTERNAAQRAAREGGTADDALRRLAERVPLGRMQTVDDVADVVSFLLSPAAGYVTGQALNACGGLEFD